MKIEVTNPALYAKVIDALISNNGRSHNLIVIYFDEFGMVKQFEADGEFGRYDYVEQFGFEIL